MAGLSTILEMQVKTGPTVSFPIMESHLLSLTTSPPSITTLLYSTFWVRASINSTICSQNSPAVNGSNWRATRSNKASTLTL